MPTQCTESELLERSEGRERDPITRVAKVLNEEGSPEKKVAMMPADEAAASAGKPLAAPELKVEIISAYNSFLKLEQIWNRLVEEAGIDHPFLNYEWMRTWWECFGAGKELHILVVKEGGEVIAIAPLILSCERIYGFKVRCLRSLYNLHTPRCSFIVTRRPEEAYRAVWQSLASQKRLWDVLELHQLPAGSRTLEELLRLAAENGFLTGLWRSEDSPYVPLIGTWEDYFNKLDGKHRSNLRNRLKRLSKLGQVELEEISSPAELDGALDDSFRLEAAGWKGEAGTAISCHPELRCFYTSLAKRAAQHGWLRLHFLTVNGRRIASGYSLCHKNKLYLLKPGYDPQYAPYSPFNLLCYSVLRDAFQRALAEYDFLGDVAEWKMEWTKETRPHYWLYVFPNALYGRVLYLAKFQLVPRLRRQPLFLALRDAVLGTGKARNGASGQTPYVRAPGSNGRGLI